MNVIMKKFFYKFSIVLLLVILYQCIGIEQKMDFQGNSYWHLHNIANDNMSYYRTMYIYDLRFFISTEFARMFFPWGYVKDNIIISNDSTSSIGKFCKKSDGLYLTIKEESDSGELIENTYLAIKKDSCNPSEDYFSEFDLKIDLPISEEASETSGYLMAKGGNIIGLLRIGYPKKKGSCQSLHIYNEDEEVPFDSMKIKAEWGRDRFGDSRDYDNILIEADKNTPMSLIDSIRKELHIAEFQKFYFACINPEESSVKYLKTYHPSEEAKAASTKILNTEKYPTLIFKLDKNKSVKFCKSIAYYKEVVEKCKKEEGFTNLSTHQLQQLIKENLNANLVIFIDYPPSLPLGDYIYFQTQIRIAAHALRSEYALKTYRIVFENLNDVAREEIYNLFPLQYSEINSN